MEKLFVVFSLFYYCFALHARAALILIVFCERLDVRCRRTI